MIVYHGSTEIIKNPDVVHSKKYLDFGEDFILQLSKIRQRNGQSLNKEYDIIIGNVADDDVFKTVDMYFRGLWNKEKVLNELRYYKMNNQICIVNQETLNRLITFKRAYEVENNGR